MGKDQEVVQGILRDDDFPARTQTRRYVPQGTLPEAHFVDTPSPMLDTEVIVLPNAEFDDFYQAARRLCEYGPSEIMREKLRSDGKKLDAARFSNPTLFRVIKGFKQ